MSCELMAQVFSELIPQEIVDHLWELWQYCLSKIYKLFSPNLPKTIHIRSDDSITYDFGPKMIGRFRKRQSTYQRIACTVCNSSLLGLFLYVLLLGVIGTVLSIFDVIRIINNNKLSSQEIRRAERRRESGSTENPRNIETSSLERDLRLITSVLSVEHYILIIIGAITGYPILHTPWLIIQFCALSIELTVFFIRLFVNGLHVTCDEILLAVFTTHNWMQVFCLFHRQT